MDGYDVLTKLTEVGPISTWQAFEKNNGRLVTLSKILVHDTETIANKLKFLLDLKHPNVIPYYDIFQVVQPPAQSDENAVFVVKAFYETETLEEYIQREFIDFDLMMDYLIQIAHGISYVHSLKLIHGEIQPRRVHLCLENNQKVCKIDDFNFYCAIQDYLPSDQSMGSTSYIAPEVTHPSLYCLKSDWFSFGAMIYKMSRRERIERIWVVVMANQKGNTDHIVWDIGWFRPKTLAQFTAKLFEMDPKMRPNDDEILSNLERIRDEKGASRDDMLYMEKIKWYQHEAKFLEFVRNYESYYQDFEGVFKINSKLLIFEYMYNITGFIKKDGSSESFFKKFCSGRANWFTCDKMCQNEQYWIESYEKDPSWREYVDKQQSRGISSPQEYYKRIQQHFLDLYEFVRMMSSMLDNQDTEYRDFTKWEPSIKSILRRMNQNISCRKYSTYIRILEYPIQGIVLHKYELQHVKCGMNVLFNNEAYVLLLLDDMNDGVMVLIPEDLGVYTKKIYIIALAATCLFKSFSCYFSETLLGGNMLQGCLMIQNEQDRVNFDMITTRVLEDQLSMKIEPKQFIQNCLNRSGESQIVYEKQTGSLIIRNQEVWRLLFDHRVKSNMHSSHCMYDTHFKFQ